MTTTYPHEKNISTIEHADEYEYVKASEDKYQLTHSTRGEIQNIRTVSTSKLTGEVKLRLSPREIPTRIVNVKTR